MTNAPDFDLAAVSGYVARFAEARRDMLVAPGSRPVSLAAALLGLTCMEDEMRGQFSLFNVDINGRVYGRRARRFCRGRFRIGSLALLHQLACVVIRHRLSVRCAPIRGLLRWFGKWGYRRETDRVETEPDRHDHSLVSGREPASYRSPLLCRVHPEAALVRYQSELFTALVPRN